MNVTNSNSRVYDKTENGTSIIPPGQEVNQDIFLKMLVAQMTNQDPFNPQDPTQYVTQLAQFTMLDQTMQTNEGMQILVGLNNAILVNTAMSTASSLIGKNVELTELDADSNVVNAKGEVQSTYIKDGIVYLEVKLEDSEEIKSFRYESLTKVS
ncbi:MAG: flagellar hook assembly protein FlgD [Peptostreptococcaceae bacterium]